MDSQLHNVNVVSKTDLPTPAEVKAALPLDAATEKSIIASRQVIRNIHDRRDPRLFVVVGPCSIHDIGAAHEYAARLKVLADRIADTILVVMRVYFEKPRTTVGWKGLINDPYMDDSFHVEKGIFMARELLLYLAKLGLPTATEALDPIMPQYLGDLVTWTAIGARTIRPDGADKVTGRAQYSADTAMPGMVWGKVLRSPYAHALIKKIDTSQAAAMKGVLAVMTGDDLPLLPLDKPLPTGPNDIRWISRGCMAREKILYVGHPIAAVAATSQSIADAALAMIEIAHWYENVFLLGWVYLFFASIPALGVAVALGWAAGSASVEAAPMRRLWSAKT